jgi:hypothetical protein
MAEPVRHRQTKRRQQICSTYSYRATPRLYRLWPFAGSSTNDQVGWIAAIRKVTNKQPASTRRGHSREPPGRSEADLREEQQSVREENGCDQRCSII